MEQVDLLLGLPHALVLELLHRWLTLKWVARLDSAICNKMKRTTLESTLRFDVYKNYPLVTEQFDAFYSWTFARDIRLVCVTLDETLPYAKLVKLLSVNCSTIRRIFLQHKRTDISAILSDISYHFKELELLKIGGSFVTASLRTVLLNCTIKALYLHPANQTGDISAETFSGILCPDTTALTLPSTVNDETVDAAVRSFPVIRRLQLHMSETITNKSILAIANRCSFLIAVDFYRNHLITDEAMSTLYKACPGLVAVDVGKCVSLSDRSFLDLAAHCTQLKRLSMRINPRVTDKSLVAIAQGCKKLNVLSCEGSRRITNKGIQAIATGCRRMRTFHFGRNKVISRSAVLAVAENCTELVEMGILDMVVDSDLLIQATELCGKRMKRLHFIKCRTLDPELHSTVLAQRAAHPRLSINMDAPEFRANIITHEDSEF